MSPTQITQRINTLLLLLERSARAADLIARNHPDREASTYYRNTAAALKTISTTARRHYPPAIIV